MVRNKLALLPDKPGVYIFKDKAGEVIYVGKAVSLRNRVRQYFQDSSLDNVKTARLVANICDMEYIVTQSELEALMLECNLIKKYKPKFNISLKDDKNYPYLKLTREKFPRFVIVRRVEEDGARYFGPYPNTRSIKEFLRIIKGLFPLRECRDDLSKKRERECLYYQIKQCSAPCTGRISAEEYGKLCEEALMLLEGNLPKLIKRLEEEMEKEAKNLNFEKAAKLRDKIFNLNNLIEKQKAISISKTDRDVIAFVREGDCSYFQVLFIRKGYLLGSKSFVLEDTEELSDGEIMEAFIKQFYSYGNFVPDEILLQTDIEDKELISEYLSGIKGSKVKILFPKKGEKANLINMAYENAKETLKQEFILKRSVLEKLARYLNLDKVPVHIEAFDISNISGSDIVGGMVVFKNGVPDKKEYRMFKIRTVGGMPDDYSAMKEVFERRIKKRDLPDLFMVDGGFGHVNAVSKILRELNTDIPVCGMVKDEKHRTRALVYNNKEIEIHDSDLYNFIVLMQKEVHRFALNYHKNLRDKKMKASILDDIPGIGEKRKKSLLSFFGSVENIRKASIEELSKVEGMNARAAKMVYDYFHAKEGMDENI